jgi:predicted  nucleic acid-binding Zn-ribbon protein
MSLNSLTDSRQALERLEREQEQLRMMSALIDSHVQEFVSTIQRKRSHLANIGSLAPGVSLARQCYAEIEEMYSGSEYRRVMAHIEHYQTALAEKRQRLAARIDALRHQAASAGSFADGGVVVEMQVMNDRRRNDVL